jgi:sugar O-acyltransferase (sialic acid O-acetyltransferase NeuD family)
MIVVGAKGLAKEILEIFYRNGQLENLFFFDNVTPNSPEKLFSRFPILRSMDDVLAVFKRLQNSSFSLGLGSPILRYQLTNAFQKIGGQLESVISPNTEVGNFGTSIAPGAVILAGSVITNNVSIGTGCLINPGVSISHDSSLGRFVELSPGARITGNCTIGDFCSIGTNASVLPKIRLGVNVVVGAGAVVTRDIPDNSLVVGVPAIVKKKLPPLSL